MPCSRSRWSMRLISPLASRDPHRHGVWVYTRKSELIYPAVLRTIAIRAHQHRLCTATSSTRPTRRGPRATAARPTRAGRAIDATWPLRDRSLSSCSPSPASGSLRLCGESPQALRAPQPRRCRLHRPRQLVCPHQPPLARRHPGSL